MTQYQMLMNFSLASYLKRETDYLPLYTGLSALGKIENVLRRTPDYGAFQKFMRRLVTDVFQKSGGLAVKKILNGDDLTSVKMQVRGQFRCFFLSLALFSNIIYHIAS